MRDPITPPEDRQGEAFIEVEGLLAQEELIKVLQFEV